VSELQRWVVAALLAAAGLLWGVAGVLDILTRHPDRDE